MKRVLAIVLGALLVFSLAACVQQPVETTPPTTQATVPTTQVPTTTEEPVDLSLRPFVEPGSVTLTIGLIKNGTVSSYEDNYVTQYLERETGIDLRFVLFPMDYKKAQDQLLQMVENGEPLPDILLGMVDDYLRVKLGKEGVFTDLTPYFETSSYYMQDGLAAITDAAEDYLWAEITEADGNIYAFPAIDVSDSPDQCAYVGGLNRVWAEKVGMDAGQIDTVGEVYVFLKKVSETDLNGNGENDEMGMLYRQGSFRSNLEQWIINAYVYCVDDDLFNVTGGQVWSPYATDEYRQALIELNKWFQEGLIEKKTYDGFTDQDMKNMLARQNMAIWGGHPSLMTSGTKQMADTYAPLKVLGDETGKGGYAPLRSPYSIQKNAFITSQCSEPELAFRLLDFMWDDTCHHVMRYGEEGVNWEHMDGSATGETDALGLPAGLRVLKDEWQQETSATWKLVPVYGKTGLHGGTPLTIPEGHRNAISYGCMREMYRVSVPEELCQGMVFNTKEQKVLDTHSKDYKAYVLQARWQFIMGVMDPNDDAQWSAYLLELKAKGEEPLLEAYQTAYTRIYG